MRYTASCQIAGPRIFRPFRDYAVRCLERLTDSELVDYMHKPGSRNTP